MESVKNGLQPYPGATLFVSIDFNGSCITNVITQLTLGVNRTLSFSPLAILADLTVMDVNLHCLHGSVGMRYLLKEKHFCKSHSP